jgi:Putative phage serine protease XkdF
MTILVQKKDTPEPEEQRMIYGEVYAPDRPDADGEFMTAETIRKMAHDFIRDGLTQSIDLMHNNELVKNGACIVESWIASKDDKTFIPGSWVIGMHIPDDTLWKAAKEGVLNGFSLEAMAVREEKEVMLEIPPVVSGLTTKSEAHEHKFFVTYDEAGVFKGGKTDEIDGHFHLILAGTHTDKWAPTSFQFC